MGGFREIAEAFSQRIEELRERLQQMVSRGILRSHQGVVEEYIIV